MMYAYSEWYVEQARQTFGAMLDYVVNDLRYPVNEFYDMFLGTDFADGFSHGDPWCVAGRSGEELAREVLWKVKREECRILPDFRPWRSREYWGGWILAGYQWYRNISFRRIARAVSCQQVIDHYEPYHEMDERQFYDVLDSYIRKEADIRRLKRLRQYAQLSQSQLAARSGVPVRTIQQYEQGQKEINHAKGSTLLRLADALGCRMEDLLEIQTPQ